MQVALDWLIKRPWWVLALGLALETIIFVAGQGDFVASDPLWYADLAHRISINPADVFGTPSNHPFEMRVGLTLPLALLYKVFGVSVLISDLPGLLAALGVLLVGYSAAATPRAKVLAVAFGVTSVALVRYSSMLNIDLPCAALMACSVLWLSRSDRERGTWWVTGAVVMWFAAFLVKESAVWLAPVWVYAVVRDIRANGWRQALRIYAPGAFVGAGLAVGYLAVCAAVWGDAFARFRGINQLVDDHDWTLRGQPAIAWLQRLTWGPAVLLMRLFGATLVPVIALPRLVAGRDRIWVVSTATIVLLFWFGSSSLAAYAPLPLSPRMILPALPGMIVLAALATDRAFDRITTTRWRRIIGIGLAGALVIPAAISITSFLARSRPQTTAYAALDAEVKNAGRQVVLVCDDGRCKAISEFYFGLDLPPNLTIITTDAVETTPRPADAIVRVMVYIPRGAHPRELEQSNALVKRFVGLGFPVMMQHPDLWVFDAGDGARLWLPPGSPR